MRKYIINHETYTSAVTEAIQQATEQGYETNGDDRFHQISVANKKPKAGQIVRFSLELYKNGKLQRKALQVQIYNRETNFFPYELNCYIN